MEFNEEDNNDNDNDYDNYINGRDQENESLHTNKKRNNSKRKKSNKNTFMFILWGFIIISTFSYFFYDAITNENSIINKKHKIVSEVKPKSSFFLNISFKKLLKFSRERRDKKYKRDVDDKIGVAFLFPYIFGNGIGRMLSLLANELVKIEKYDVYMLTIGNYTQDFSFDERVIRLNIYENKTQIKNLDKNSNILYYILQNEFDSRRIDWIRTFNKKVINILHGAYLASLYSNSTEIYSTWKVHNSFDAFISVVPDDYYIYKIWA